MRNEIIAVRGGYETDYVTHAVAVPIYQTVRFDNAEHGAPSYFDAEAAAATLKFCARVTETRDICYQNFRFQHDQN